MHRNNNLIIIIILHISCHVFKHLFATIQAHQIVQVLTLVHKIGTIILHLPVPGRTVIRQRHRGPFLVSELAAVTTEYRNLDGVVVFAALPQRIA